MTERAFLKECLSEPATPEHLQAQIMARIQRSILRRLWMETLAALTVTLGFLTYLFFARSTLLFQTQESSFLQISRLFVSDPDIAFSNAREAALSLLASLPSQMVFIGLVLLLFVTCTATFWLRVREARAQPFEQTT